MSTVRARVMGAMMKLGFVPMPERAERHDH
jgi:hypothetical protein